MPHKMLTLLLLPALTLLLPACQSGSNGKSSSTPSENAGVDAPASQPAASAPESAESGQPLAAPVPEGMAVATFAGGCFWCMEGPFEKIEGVSAAISGYTGGEEKRPTYKEVSSGDTGHTEAVRVIYDPSRVTYDVLLDAYWRSMDPTDARGQFADRGSQYRPAIFVHDDTQRELATASKKALEESKRFDAPIIVPIEDASDFWVAEDYHQDYYKTNPERYQSYRMGSGRAGFLAKTWADESKK